MNKLKNEVKDELINHILPFWSNLIDNENGGYYSNMDNNLALDKTGDKGCILNSRILWFFSNAYLTLKDDNIKESAKHSYEFLKNSFYDKEFGGVFWSVDYKGNPKDTVKHSYNIAFAIYGLSSYYEASGDEEALKMANDFMELLEDTYRDEYGYKEALTRDYKPDSNEHLSENGILADKTMNTMLHVFEAYTQLYKVSKNEKAREAMIFILDIFKNKIYNPSRHRMEVFFDAKMNSLIDLHSFGHDIEVAWLLEKGINILKDDNITEQMKPIMADLEQEILRAAYDGESVAAEAENSVILQKRVWWVQCEAMIGFYNAYMKRPEEKQYLSAVENIWEYVKEFVIDHREGGEWFGEIAYDSCHSILDDQIMVSAWKCPYHNGRMCMELLNRIPE